MAFRTAEAEELARKSKELNAKLEELKIDIEADKGSGSDEIKVSTKVAEYYNLLIEKDRLLLMALSGLFKEGKIVEDELSMRRGNFYHGRNHSEMSLRRTKETIIKQIVYVNEEVSKDNLDLLEALLGMINDDDYQEGWWGSLKEISNEKDIMRSIKTIRISEIQTSYDERITFAIKEINRIVISPNGSITWKFYETKSNDRDNYTNISIEDRHERVLIKEYASEIKEILEEYDKKFTELAQKEEKQIDIIKEKFGKLIVMCSLTRKEKK